MKKIPEVTITCRKGGGSIKDRYPNYFIYWFEGEFPCHGDDGGPTFAHIDGSQRIIGVISEVDANCAEFGTDTRVDYYADWIADTISGCDGCDIDSGAQPDAGEFIEPDDGCNCSTVRSRHNGYLWPLLFSMLPFWVVLRNNRTRPRYRRFLLTFLVRHHTNKKE